MAGRKSAMILKRWPLLPRSLLSDLPNKLSSSSSAVSNPSTFRHFSTKTLTTTAHTDSPPPFSSQSNSPLFFFSSRCFSSSPTGPSNVVAIKSEQDFNSSLSKAKDDSLPVIFYFTATWCGPCKVISPVIEELSKIYPNVTTYKIDIDQEDLQKTLSLLNIYSVPTLHFYKNGQKTSEVVGADIRLLRETMESLYKQA